MFLTAYFLGISYTDKFEQCKYQKIIFVSESTHRAAYTNRHDDEQAHKKQKRKLRLIGKAMTSATDQT